MRLPALLLTLFATSALFAADAPKPDAPKGDTPAAKPAEKAEPKPAAKKKKAWVSRRFPRASPSATA